MAGSRRISEIGLVFTTIFSEICLHWYLQNKLPVHTKVVFIKANENSPVARKNVKKGNGLFITSRYNFSFWTKMSYLNELGAEGN